MRAISRVGARVVRGRAARMITAPRMPAASGPAQVDGERSRRCPTGRAARRPCRCGTWASMTSGPLMPPSPTTAGWSARSSAVEVRRRVVGAQAEASGSAGRCTARWWRGTRTPAAASAPVELERVAAGRPRWRPPGTAMPSGRRPSSSMSVAHRGPRPASRARVVVERRVVERAAQGGDVGRRRRAGVHAGRARPCGPVRSAPAGPQTTASGRRQPLRQRRHGDAGRARRRAMRRCRPAGAEDRTPASSRRPEDAGGERVVDDQLAAAPARPIRARSRSGAGRRQEPQSPSVTRTTAAPWRLDGARIAARRGAGRSRPPRLPQTSRHAAAQRRDRVDRPRRAGQPCRAGRVASTSIRPCRLVRASTPSAAPCRRASRVRRAARPPPGPPPPPAARSSAPPTCRTAGGRGSGPR